MKKIKSVLTVVLILALTVCAGCRGGTVLDTSKYMKSAVNYSTVQKTGNLEPNEKDTEGWKLSQQNDYLSLYYNEATAEVKVFDKRSGNWWTSNPKDNSDISNAALSQLSVSTISKKGQKNEYTSYSDSLSKKQVTFENKKALKVTYTFGDAQPDLAGVPPRLTDARFNELKALAAEKGANDSLFKRRYMQGSDGIWQRKASVTPDQAKKLRQVFEAIGYTEADLKADMAATGGGSEDESSSFTIPLEYKLDKDSLKVTINGDEIVYPNKEIITSLRVLNYFGALNKGENGYFFVPNGSGALVNTGADLGNKESVSIPIYGTDYTIAIDKKSGKEMANMLPVFGISRERDGAFAIIEDNEAIASVDIVKSAENGKMNTIGADFALNAVENIGLSDNALSRFYVTSDVKYGGDTAIRYIFLTEENRDYSGMASVYRSYLDSTQGRKRLKESGSTPLYVETVGSIKAETSTLGIVHKQDVALTTFDDDKKIIDDLSSCGISNVKLILSGWMNGGEDQKIADKVDIMSVLGGKSGFNSLLAYAEKKGCSVYPKLLLNSFSGNSSSMTKNSNSSKTFGSKKSTIYQYDLITGDYIEDSERYILSPSRQLKVANGLLSKMQRAKIGSVLIDDLAATAYSDYNNNSEFLRQYSVMQSAGIVKSYSEALDGLMLTAPNVNTARYGSLYTDIPNFSGSYRIFDNSVPFYQMLYHGYADYSSSAVNFTSDFRTNLLKCVEYGSCLKFTFVYEEDTDTSAVEKTKYYAARYSRWKEQMAEAYKEADELLAPVRSAKMVSHKRLSGGVYKTSYDNGVSLYVNYNEFAVTADGLTIPPQKAVSMGGEKQ